MALQVWDIGGQTLGGQMLDKYVYASNVSSLTFNVMYNDKKGQWRVLRYAQ